MQNDDINSRTIAIVKKASIVTAKQVINLMKKILEINKHKTQTEQSRPLEKFKKVKVKDLVKRYGVKFSIKKDLENGNNIIFFQAKDIKVMEQAFKKTVQKFTKDKSRKRKSLIERLNNFKDKVKDTIDRDKVKHKHQEQSL